MRVAIFGATGVLGRQVIPRLLERGDQVVAIKHQRHSPWLAALGCDVRNADILDPGSIVPAIMDCEAVMHLATAIPTTGTSPDWARNDHIRRDGTSNLIAACGTIGIHRYVQQSIAMLCAGHGDSWVDESTPVVTNHVTRSAADMEASVTQSGLDYRIVRGGLFYGNGCGMDDRWRSAARSNQLGMPGNGSAYLSLVQVSDMAEAMVLALHTDAQNCLVNVVDDQPVTYRELFTYIAKCEAASNPREGLPDGIPSFRVRNLLARQLLGWTPHFPTYRSGLA
jgi:nucleoside-diphosphate-sugar epimerase